MAGSAGYFGSKSSPLSDAARQNSQASGGTSDGFMGDLGKALGFQAYVPNSNASQIAGSGARTAQYGQMQKEVGNRQAALSNSAQLGPAAMAQAAQLDGGAQAQMRGRQVGFLDTLDAQLRGEGPSVAQQQMQRGLDSNLAQAASLASVQRGAGNAGLAQRQLGQQRAAVSQQGAADSSMLRAQEQLSAQGQMGQALAGVRGQDLSFADANAQLQQQAGLANQGAGNQFALQQGAFQQQTGLANQQAQNAQQAQNDAFRQFLLSQSDDINSQEMQARMGLEGLRAQSQQTASDNRAGFFGQLLNTAGSIAGSVVGG